MLCLLLSGCAARLQTLWQQEAPTGPDYALIDVTVLPIVSEARPHQTVLVHQGRIQALGPAAQLAIPAGYQRLELAGKYLLPGLTDMHVHLADERDLLLFLRAGVTTVRNMAAYPWWTALLGTPDARNLRQQVRTGELPGPEIVACGPMLEGEPAQNLLTRVVLSPAEAEAAVAETAAGGYDCVKVYNHLAKANFAAVLRRARLYRLPVVGHVPYEVGLQPALHSGMRTMEHLNAYIDNFASSYRFPLTAYPELAAKTRAAGVYNCPTLVVWDQHPPYAESEIEKMPENPHYRYLSPAMQAFWRLSIPGLYDLTYADKADYPAHQLAISSRVVKMLADAGAPLLIGTDANLTGVYPGSSTLREMELFAQAGVPPREILLAATLQAARALDRVAETGSIEVGKRADLLVLDQNPLTDIRQIHSLYGVLHQQRWLTVETLDRLIAAAYAAS